MILKIILAIFGLLPKDLRKAGEAAYKFTSWLKQLLIDNRERLEGTQLDEKAIQVIDYIQPFLAKPEQSLDELFDNLTDEAKKAILAQIGMLLMKQELGDKYRNSTLKLALEAAIAKDRHS